MKGAFESEIIAVRDEAPGVKTFTLKVPEEFDFVPGMFVMTAFKDAPKEARAYSIASSPTCRGSIELTLAGAGEFSRKALALRKGDAVLLTGPQGKWVYSDDIGHAVLITEGTGIAPCRAMARYVLDKKLPNKISIFYSAKTSDGFLYGAELEEFERQGIRVWKGTVRPDAELLANEVPDFRKAHFFFCGPNKLVDALIAGLEGKGIPRSQMRYEKWGDF